jgi:hypothetical protein
MGFVNTWNVFGNGEPRKLSEDEILKLRQKIKDESDVLRKQGATEEVINDFLMRCEKIFTVHK